jgi:hypothetical protein
VLLLACGVLTSAAVAAALESAKEHRAHADVLCARFAAMAGGVLGPSYDGHPEVVDETLGALVVGTARDARGRCFVTAQATCGDALRAVSLFDAEPSHCVP